MRRRWAGMALNSAEMQKMIIEITQNASRQITGAAGCAVLCHLASG
jgi:hypothetical protein